MLCTQQRTAEAASARMDNCLCHSDKLTKKYVHLPVKDGECQSCHKPTDQRHPKFKKEAFTMTGGGKAALCHECHDRKDTKKYVHPPVASGDCTHCHDPHQSDKRFQLKEDGWRLCLSCHEKSKFDRAFPHKPIAEGKCQDCHDPHQSDHKYMLKASGVGLCMTCHDKTMFNGKSIHMPVAKGECTACHAPHGTQYHDLLIDAVPGNMYQPYVKSSYALCFRCHADTLADNAETGSDTNFRNGLSNLHHLHVNKADKGRTCKACHDPHASNQGRIVSGKVSGFGRWRIPIRFTMTTVGGTCVVGCHKPKSYDRINPVHNP